MTLSEEFEILGELQEAKSETDQFIANISSQTDLDKLVDAYEPVILPDMKPIVLPDPEYPETDPDHIGEAPVLPWEQNAEVTGASVLKVAIMALFLAISQ